MLPQISLAAFSSSTSHCLRIPPKRHFDTAGLARSTAVLLFCKMKKHTRTHHTHDGTKLLSWEKTNSSLSSRSYFLCVEEQTRASKPLLRQGKESVVGAPATGRSNGAGCGGCRCGTRLNSSADEFLFLCTIIEQTAAVCWVSMHVYIRSIRNI